MEPMARDFQNPKSRTATLNASSSSQAVAPADSCNLVRFLNSTAPSLPVHFLQQTSFKTGAVEDWPYYTLRELWDSYQEWSVYGVGVRFLLDSGDHIIQYYVPYLSAIQLYGAAKKGSSSLDKKNNIDSCKDSSFHSEHFLEDYGYSSFESAAAKSQGCLLFQYLERDSPYVRPPLTNKVTDLACQFPELYTLKSYDLLPASWISIAWYPIYRIPVGPTLHNFDACFLTYHLLSTPIRGAGVTIVPRTTKLRANSCVKKSVIPTFGLASYKFKNSLLASSKECESQLLDSFLQAAENWLRILDVKHPDFQFIEARGARRR